MFFCFASSCRANTTLQLEASTHTNTRTRAQSTTCGMRRVNRKSKDPIPPHFFFALLGRAQSAEERATAGAGVFLS